MAMHQTKSQQINTLELLDSASTLAFAARVGSRLKGGEVIELIGDLGAGKTTFVIGLAKGAGITEQVSSPSFTIRNDYSTKGLSIAHFDFFRLSESGDLQEILAETLNEPQTVVAVEWADTLSHVLPSERIKLKFRPLPSDSRAVEVAYPIQYAYLFEGEF